MNKKIASLMLAALVCSGAHAKDFGVQGTVWPITETDIRQLLVENASRVDWTKAQEQAKHSANRYVDSLPKRQLPVSERSEIAWVDPSIVLSSDIQVPVKQPNGSFSWQVLYPKGTKANPLEQFRPVTAMLLFDGSQPEQVEMVREVLTIEPNRIVPVEAGGGNLKDDIEALKRPIFYANDAMVNRFQIRYLPSLVFAGSGEKRMFLGVASFGLPFKPAEVIASWPDLLPRQPVSPTPKTK